MGEFRTVSIQTFSFEGGLKELTCNRCQGLGVIVMSDWERSEITCPDCNGAGRKEATHED